MPELVEVEIYRSLAERCLGRTVARADTPDAWYLRRTIRGRALSDLVSGLRLVAARRRGKLLLLDLADGVGGDGLPRPGRGLTLGLRFGMTGRLLVDGDAAVERLEYGSNRPDPAWDRFALHFTNGGSLVMRDPRRLGAVEVDPDEGALGPDADRVRPAGLSVALAGSTVAVKARLMDQRRLAGLGNLLTDETLWRARLDPRRPAGDLDDDELRRLHRALRSTVRTLTRRGGSHTGDLQGARHQGAACPRCGADLRRDTVGGRTTYWCPVEQH